MSASSDYLAAVERALEIQGQAQSNAVLQRGQIWGNYLNNVGQSLGQTVQSLMQARQDQRLREVFDMAAKRSVAATMPQYGPLDPRTVEGAAAAGGAEAVPAENYLAGQPPPQPDQTASAPGPTNPALSFVSPVQRGFASPSLFAPPSMAGAASAAAAPPLASAPPSAPPTQASTEPSAPATPSPLPTGTPTPPNAGAINWLLTTPKLTDKERQSILDAQQQGDLNAIPQSVWDKAHIKKAAVQKYIDNTAINAALAAAPTRTPAAAPPVAAIPTAQAMPPGAVATSGAAPAASAPSPDSASSPPESPAAPAAAPPPDVSPSSAAAPPPAAATSPAAPPGAPPQIPPELAAAMAGATVSPFPTPQEIIKAVGPTRGLPIINAIAAIQMRTEGDPAKVNAQLQAFYKGLQNLPVDMQQQAYPMLRDVAIRAAGELGPMLARVLPPNFSDVQSKYFLGQMKPVEGPPKTEAELRRDMNTPGSPTAASSAATIQQWEADRKALRTQGGNEATNKRYIDIMAKPAAQRTSQEQAWVNAFDKAKQDEQDRQFEKWKQERQFTLDNATFVARGTDANGNQVYRVVPRTVGTTVQGAPSATIQNRTASAKVALQVSDDIEQKLQDPNYLKTIGPILGRYSRVEDWYGDPPPELRELMGMFKGYSDAMTSVHGYRSPENAARIAQLLTTKSTPEAIISALHGLNDFSLHLLDDEHINVTKPIPGFPGTEQTYQNGKWVRTK